MAEDQAVAAAREAALRLLERARRTRKELERKLKDAGHAREVVARALDRLTEVGLVDDLEAAKGFARAQWARRITSRRVVRGRLLARGVAAEVIDEALAALEAEGEANDDVARSPTAEGERERALRVAAGLRRRYARLEPPVARARLLAALARRGFARDAIAHAIARLDTPVPSP